MHYAFGDCELDLQLYELRRAGSPVKLEPQAFNMLAYLLQHRDRVVSRQELLEQLWVDQFIGDSAIERCVMAARKAVGDNGSAQRVIKTLHGRGYRFVAAVQDDPSALDHAEIAGPRSHSQRVQGHPSAETERPAAAPVVQPCPDCQHANRASAAFCEACGKRLMRALLNTVPDSFPPLLAAWHETDLQARSRLALGSQSATLVSPPQTPWGGLDGERKPITVLCCALVPESGLSRRLDADALYRLTQQFCGDALEEVTQYGGTLQHVGETELLALFGAPVAYEDHAQRAVLAALGLRQRLRQHHLKLPAASAPCPPVRIGLHTGPVMVGLLGTTPHLTYTAIGNTTRLARHLQEQAESGSILLSATTQRLVQNLVDVKRLDARTGAAGSDATAVFMVQGLAPACTRAVPAGTAMARRLMGREPEQTLLQALWEQVQHGQGQVLGIVAEAGMGKSRLLAEFRQQVKEIPVTYVEGRCVSYGSQMPYLPLRAILQQVCGLKATDNAPTRRTKIHRRLQEAGLDPHADTRYVLQVLAGSEHLPDTVTVPPASVRDRTFALLRQLCLESSRQRPCIMVVEDLHWIDAISEAYLASLAAQLATVPLFLITTYRPGYRPPWLAMSYATQIALAPLPSDASLQLMRALLPKTSLPPALTQRIVTQAAGNPFFLQELTRAAVEQNETLSTWRVPDTIQALVLARTDRLPPAAKQVLQAAAVIGIDVPVRLLQAIAELPEEQLAHNLVYLQQAEFLHETRLVPDRVYTFKQAIIQKVVYGSLAQTRRQALQDRLETLSTATANPPLSTLDATIVYPLRQQNGVHHLAYS